MSPVAIVESVSSCNSGKCLQLLLADPDATGGAEADLKEGESQERQRVRAEAGQRPEVPDDRTM